MNNIIYVIFTYLCLSVAIVFLSMKLSDYIDWLDKKTKVSGAFLGGVLLAAITSLPEMFTSFSSVLFLNETAMVMGNILGSNSFDVLILGLCILLYYKKYKNCRLQLKTHFVVIASLVVMYTCLLIPLLLGNKQLMFGKINAFFIVIAVIYFIALIIMPKNDDVQELKEEQKLVDTCPLSIKQIIFRFVVCSILLICASVFITYATSDLAVYFNLESSTAGVLFLAIATSLPEVVSTIALCNKGNFDAAFGDIIGSCLFNTFVLSVAEFISFKQTLLIASDFASLKLVILNMITISSVLIVLLLKQLKREFKGSFVVNTFLCIVMILCYAMYYII